MSHSVATTDSSEHDGRVHIQLRALLLGAALVATASAHADGFPKFRFHKIDTPGGDSWGQTSLVDIDRDGDLDFVSGRRGADVLWYEYRAADDWVRRKIGENRGNDTDVGGTAFDVDGDGWIDQVSGRAWYRSPGAPFEKGFEKLDNGSIEGSHDNVLGDVDGDGKIDLVSMKDTTGLYWYKIPADPTRKWIEQRIGAGVHGGAGVGDFDGDGDLDVVRSNWWFENLDGDGARWGKHENIDFGQPGGRFPLQTRVAVLDVNGDGAVDLVMTEGDLPSGRVAWFENAGARGKDGWKQHLIATDRGDLHSLAVADFDGDGDIDVFSGQGPLTPKEHLPHSWFIWENLAGDGSAWKEHEVLQGYRCHEAVAGDVDGDGDIDVCSKPWRGDLHVYLENLQRVVKPASGPLRVHATNRAYFSDRGGRIVYLTGSHTWSNLVDMGPGAVPAAFDFERHLTWLQDLDHNFTRLWTWELTTWDTASNSPEYRKVEVHTVTPHPWSRIGPGTALDGKPKFDLEKFDPAYFERLRARVRAAYRRGIYVSVMLFEGWGMQFSAGAWKSHPLHADNNVNGLNGDVDGDGDGLEIHTLTDARVTAVQEAYVRKVVDTVNDLDNVLYEISNENHPPSTRWQYHMIDLIHAYEKTKPKRHPVGMTFQYRGGTNDTLFESPADWISPNRDGGYRDDPPPADGRKVILNDTDHLWGIGGEADWVWKSFLRGHNPIFMDPYDGAVLGKPAAGGGPLAKHDPIRRAMGYTRHLAERMKLVAMRPRRELATSGYCLADPGNEYLVYIPAGGEVTVDLGAVQGKLDLEWFDPATGTVRARGTTRGGGRVDFMAPFSGGAVLYLVAGN